jgi:hypothetical protein
VPLVEVIVNRYVQDGVEVFAESVRTAVPEPPVTGFGENDPVAPLGRPVTLKLTGAVKPRIGITVIATFCVAGVTLGSMVT